MRNCPICNERPRVVAPVRSPFSDLVFELGECESCNLAIVLEPRTDFEELYGTDYYEGRGADPHIDYVGDERPGSIRQIEWDGIVQTVRDIRRIRNSSADSFSLLDWGAGLGGLVRTAREAGIDADGLDEGFAAKTLEAKGLNAPPLQDVRGKYDAVTAIEVVEHLVDPVSELRSMADCLKPGGFVFITTGNMAKARGPVNHWYYAQIPDVHVTFWTPRSWAKGLAEAGLDAISLPIPRVDPRIVQYKIIKALPQYRRALVATLPLWRETTRIVDALYGISEFAIGVRPSD
jgi:SAM-dependent methyltransferase